MKDLRLYQILLIGAAANFIVVIIAFLVGVKYPIGLIAIPLFLMGAWLNRKSSI